MTDAIFSIEKYVIVFYIFHILFSIIIALLTARYIKERFVKKSRAIDIKDSRRLEEVSIESLMFRLWFKVSLHKNNPTTIFLFVVVFNLALPIIGYFFTVWIAWYLKHVSYEKKVADTGMLNLEEFGSSFLKVERIFGEGSMADLMVNDYAPKSKKLKALSSLANHSTPANLQIIRQTLSSTDDEIRMFGYAIINKAEKALNSKINYYLEIIAEEEKLDNDQEVIAAAAKELAPLYWEMIYTELSHESLKNSFMESVIYYLEIAKKYYISEIHTIADRLTKYQYEVEEARMSEKTVAKNEKILSSKTSKILEQKVEDELVNQRKNIDICTKLYILMGRVRMKQKRYDDAQTEFTIAQQIQTDRLEFILPYLAEIQFLVGNYKVVKSLMEHTEGLELNSTLFPIVEQWKVS